jgi:hypothetical protein
VRMPWWARDTFGECPSNFTDGRQKTRPTLPCDGVFSSNFAARQPGIAKCDFSPKSQILTKKRMTARLSVASWNSEDARSMLAAVRLP